METISMDYQPVGTSRDFKRPGFSEITDLRQVGKIHCAIVSLMQHHHSTKENNLSNLHCTTYMQSKASLPFNGI